MNENARSQPRIEILMTSFNHAPYVGEQVESLIAQTWENWHLTISDDGSTDGSWDILQRYRERFPDRIEVVRGPGAHPTNHFSLVANADPDADYFAWCDSDDIWLSDKLARAVEMMLQHGQDTPVLYGGRTIRIDASGHRIGLAPRQDRIPPTFGHFFLETTLIGPTIVFNRPARTLIASGLGERLVNQDVFACLVVSGAGGEIIYDAQPHILYRLHSTNIANRASSGAMDYLRSFVRIMAGQNWHGKEWRRKVLSIAKAYSAALTPENRVRLQAIDSLLKGGTGPFQRLKLLRASGLRLDSKAYSAMLYVMATLNRL